ncbi:MAG: S-methyl-5'-thioadenosine phosphorylase [Ferroplasma sp.]
MTYTGIIGGSGLYSIMKSKRIEEIDTPYGKTSSPIEIGDINGVEVAFIARHGKKHTVPPHMVNYKANIFALNKLGVERVVGLNAVGSLKEEYKPGDIVIPDQFIDFTKRRDLTYYNGPDVYHISMADPFCNDIESSAYSTGIKLGYPVHKSGTYLCIEGPRFSTRAESRMFKNFADIIGMTLVPEINLTAELSMCYGMLATVTDYDAWKDEAVEATDVMEIMKQSEEKVANMLYNLIPKINDQRNCKCSLRLENAKA